MTNLVTDKHIVKFVAHILVKERKSKNTITNVKGSGMSGIAMPHRNVLASENLRKNRLRISVHFSSHAAIVPQRRFRCNPYRRKSFS